MWLSEPRLQRARQIALIGGCCLVLAAVSGCTVRPLYTDAGVNAGGLAGAQPAHASVAVRPETTRFGVEVRNHLIFLLGGASNANPLYTMALNVSAQSASAAIVQRTKDSEPTAGVVTMTSFYQLTENATSKVVATGRRSVSSSYDIPLQEFAALRAERDAQNRAARELAELLRQAVAQDLDRIARR